MYFAVEKLSVNIVEYLLKARTVTPERQPLLGNCSSNTLAAKQLIRNTQQWSKWESVFSTRSV
jgi:hypothetical protein